MAANSISNNNTATNDTMAPTPWKKNRKLFVFSHHPLQPVQSEPNERHEKENQNGDDDDSNTTISSNVMEFDTNRSSKGKGGGGRFKHNKASGDVSGVGHYADVDDDDDGEKEDDGKDACDSKGGVDKGTMRKEFKNPATFEVDDDRKMSAATVGADGKRISLGRIAMNILSDPIRINGLKGHGNKHRKREAESKIDERVHYLIDTGATDHQKNSHLHVINTKFKTVGFKSKKGETNNGIGSHYHFYADPELGPNSVAARRIPCSCNACFSQLNKEWLPHVTPKEQPRFKTADNCTLQAALQDHNDWKMLSLVPSTANEDQEEEIEELYEDILGEMEATIMNEIEVCDFAACLYDAEEDCYVFEISSLPMPCNEEMGPVEGTHHIEPGTSVVRGHYWENPGRANQWCTPTHPIKERLFRVRYIPKTGLEMETTNQKKFPASTVQKRDRKKVLKMNPRRITDECHDDVLCEMAKRARIDYEEDTELIEQKREEEEDDDDEEDEEQEEKEEEESESED